MANTVQLTQDGNIVYPITDVSCVMGLDEGAITEAVLCWDGASTPVVANIPAGVVVTYNSTTYTGTLAASADTVGKIYMVATGTSNNYNRYMTFAGSPSYVWQNIGDTTIDLSSYATKAEVTELEAKVDELAGTATIIDLNTIAQWTEGGGCIVGRSVPGYNLGDIINSSSYSYSDYLSVTPGDTLVFTNIKKALVSSGAGSCFYDSGKQAVEGIGCVLNADADGYVETTVIVPDGATYIRFSKFADPSIGDFEAYRHTQDGRVTVLEHKVDVLGQVVDDPDYIKVITDADGRLLFAITVDGSVEWWKGIPTPIRERFDELAHQIANNKGHNFSNEILVAASNAPLDDKKNATIVCDGIDDGYDISLALRVAGENAKVKLSSGTFVIDRFRKYSVQNSQNIGVPLPYFDGASFDITLSGQGCRGNNATIIQVTTGAWEGLQENEQPVVFGYAPFAGYNTFNLDNLRLEIPDNQRKVVCIDNEYLGGGDIHHITMTAHANSSLEQAPVEGCVGFRAWRGSDTGTIQITKNVVAIGFYEAFQLGAEHHILMNCGGRFNYYCWTFGNYDYHAGYNIHPIVLINCMDEHSIKYPLFANNGKSDGSNIGMQSVTFIGFNFEGFGSLAGVTNEYAKEDVPGSWCGTIEYTTDGGYYNSPTARFWENGSGLNFKTRNLAHAIGGPTALRNTYSPNYMQHFFDTDLEKELIFNGANWVDCNGTIVN